jgi:glycerol uptake facilitator-like aquaporin
METGNKDKKIGVFAYEFLGTAFIMYAVMVDQTQSLSLLAYYAGFGDAYIYITLAMMMIAWNVSGGHFNPAITVGLYISSNDFGGNAIICFLMIAG